MRPQSLRDKSVTYVSGINRYLCDRNGPRADGGQGRNRTTDTRIFSTPQSASIGTQEHRIKYLRLSALALGSASVLVRDGGLETSVETWFDGSLL